MRIGIVGPIWLDIPPSGYGGTEEVICNLVNGLYERGHDVTLFGPGNSHIKGTLVPTVDLPLRQKNIDWSNVPYTLFHMTAAFDQQEKYDLLHVHLNRAQDFLALPLALYSKTPVLFTFHFRLPSLNADVDRYAVLTKYSEFPYTSISNSQRSALPLNFIKTVYNSLDISQFPYCAHPENYFVWLGKVNPLKGTREAILAAKKAGIKLMVMGAVDSGFPHMFKYYEEEVKPLIDGKNIIWIGEVSHEDKVKYLGRARGFLNPIQWEEPFGLVMVEAMATGTPVIALKRGAASEIVQEAKTGYLVENLDEMVEKIKIIDTIDRINCRKNIEEHFTIQKMVEGYLEAYNITTAQWPKFLEAQNQAIKKIKLG